MFWEVGKGAGVTGFSEGTVTLQLGVGRGQSKERPSPKCQGLMRTMVAPQPRKSLNISQGEGPGAQRGVQPQGPQDPPGASRSLQS